MAATQAGPWVIIIWSVPMIEKVNNEEGAGNIRRFARYSPDLDLFVTLIIKRDEVISVALSTDEPTRPYGTNHPYIDRLIAHLSTGRDDLRDIPVHFDMSIFDREVLEALREIPPGRVMTYGEVAHKIGRPNAARAVGSACARNPAPIIIPCHRVVPASGGLGNYSGGKGPDTKAKLLDREKALGDLKAVRGRSAKKVEKG